MRLMLLPIAMLFLTAPAFAGDEHFVAPISMNCQTPDGSVKIQIPDSRSISVLSGSQLISGHATRKTLDLVDYTLDDGLGSVLVIDAEIFKTSKGFVRLLIPNVKFVDLECSPSQK